MGYSAELLQGAEIVIRDGDAFWRDLAIAANGSDYPGEGRFSWTNTVAEYEAETEKVSADHAVDMMAHYGFDYCYRQGQTVILTGWGGDKIGSSWDEVWDVIAQHAEPYEWFMLGEDGSHWKESNPDRKRKAQNGVITYE